MRPSTLPVLVVLAVPVLAGCPSSPYLSGMTPPPSYPMPTRPMPMPTTGPAPLLPGLIAQAPLVADGPSMDEAYHYVHRYVTQHYPGAEFVAARSSQVAAPGRIAKAGFWSFTYRMQETQAASASLTAQTVDLPTQFEHRRLTFKLNGNLDLFAPEAEENATLQPIEYARVIPLAKALEICQGSGLNAGPAGVSIALHSDSEHPAVYEIGYTVSYQSTPTYGYNPGYPQPTPSPVTLRGTYRLDALSGALLEHLKSF